MTGGTAGGGMPSADDNVTPGSHEDMRRKAMGFGRKPMHFFGLLGLLMFLLSSGLFLGIGTYKVWAMANGIPAKNLADLSWFFVALTGMILGAQFFLAGFLAEMVSRTDPERTDYRILTRLEAED